LKWSLPLAKNTSDDDGPEEYVMSILAKHKDEVKTLQSSKQNTTVKFGGLGILDLGDYSTWIERHLPGYQYG
jgi:hypothetical protein